MSVARAEYQSRLAARRDAASRLERWDRALSWTRGLLVASALAIAWLAWRRHSISALTLIVPAAAFLAALVVHDRILRRWSRTRRAVSLYERALARLDDKWDQLTDDGSRFLDPQHPYAADLDLFGPHSLYQLLCTARTAPGESTLARWLTTPAAPGEIRERQHAVAELRPRLDLREELWIAGQEARSAIEASALDRWGKEPDRLSRRGLRPLLFLGALVMAVTGVGWMSGRLPAGPAALAAALVLLATQFFNARVTAVVDAVARPDARLTLLAELTQIFERAFAPDQPGAPTSDLLQRLHARLHVDGKPASRQIARLAQLVRVLAWQHNVIFTPVAYALLWRPQFAAAIEAWRRRNGPHVGDWVQVVADLEALCAFATFSYDHPERPFPHLLPATGGPVYQAEALAHPLLPGCVPNDVRLGGGDKAEGTRLMVLSGSNMSGKSTLMRTVGVNAVLALAGAPVHAASLSLSPLTVGATLRIQDSLASGTSRFYAEVTRLRQLVDLARGPVPLLFLIDEILAGTNSHDRRLGAISVLGGLVRLGAVGIASTHDLALTEVVKELPGRAANYHFQDDLKDGVMSFDYHLQTGVVQRSNALALMRAVGLDV